jgi:hypothetical protein
LSVIKGNHAGSAGGDFYSHKINQSLRFNDGDSAYLSKSFGSNGNLKKFTLSFWFKISILGTDVKLIGSSYTSSSEFAIRHEDTGELRYYSYAGGGTSASYDLTTTRKFRDSNAWYHMVFVWDTAQSTAADRVKIYINGVQETVFSNAVYPAQDYSGIWNLASHTFYIGGTQYYDGYLAEFHHLDGIAGDPTSLGLGETKDGVWIPKSYSGSHGTNGFYLPFDDSSAIGDDESANTNDWTVNNLAATDVVKDSPTNNFATMSPLLTDTNNTTFSEGNLKTVNSAASTSGSSIAVNSGKWFVEMICTAKTATNAMIGICTVDGFDGERQLDESQNGGSGHGYVMNATKLPGGASYGATWAVDDVIGIALDLDSSQNTVTFYKNGSTQGAIDIDNALYVFCNSNGQGSSTVTYATNFGQDGTFAGEVTAGGNADGNGVGDFKYSVPSGYLALCTENLPDVTIGPGQSTLATDYFNTVLWTGNGSDGRSITGVGFDPDWVWIKSRNLTTSHLLTDTVRGANKSLFSEATTVETADNGGGYLSAFVTDGFSVTSGSSGDDAVNDGSDTYVAWNWLAGTAFSNSSGANGANVDSSGQVNTTAGFSIVSWQFTNSADNLVFHGLSSAPEAMFLKSRTTAYNWDAYFSGLTAANKRLMLNSNSAEIAGFFDTRPTSSVFEYNTSALSNNDNAIAYCFHSVEGYSKIGSYTGNGSADGTFVFTGFKPAWVIIKSLAGYDWVIDDVARAPFNEMNATLFSNVTNVEYTGGAYGIDFLSNGFKPRTAYGQYNLSGTYVYLAFASQPFKFANAR